MQTLLLDHSEFLKAVDSTETAQPAEAGVRDEEGGEGDDLDARELSSLLAKAAVKVTGEDVKADGDNNQDIVQPPELVPQ